MESGPTDTASVQVREVRVLELHHKVQKYPDGRFIIRQGILGYPDGCFGYLP